MELLTISENLSQISKHLNLLQKYISIKVGSDWAQDFKNFCGSHQTSTDNEEVHYNQHYEEAQTFDNNDQVEDDHDMKIIIHPETSSQEQNSSSSITNLQECYNNYIDDAAHIIKTEDQSFENLEQEFVCVVNVENAESLQQFSDLTDPLETNNTAINNTLNTRSRRRIKRAINSGQANEAIMDHRRAEEVQSSSNSTQAKQPASYQNVQLNSAKQLYRCHVCGKEFGQRYKLGRHSAVHTDGRIPCMDKNCTEIFKRIDYMKDHYKNIHLKLKTRLCAHCNQRLSRNAYTNHVTNRKCPKLISSYLK